MANNKSSLVQIAQDVLDEATQSLKVTVASGGTGLATEATSLDILAEVESIDAKTPPLVSGRVPVDVQASVLPTGAATEATSAAILADTADIEVAVESIDAKTPALVSGRVPVDVQASVLPSGASTAANQSTANTSLASIDTKLSSQSTAANQSTMITRLDTLITQTDAVETTLTSIDTKQTNGLALTQVYSAQSQKSLEVDTIGGAKITNVVRVFGDAFANGIGGGDDTGTFPTSATLVGAATGNVTGGYLQLRTNNGANGNSAILQSLRTLRQRSGTVQAMHGNFLAPSGFTSFAVVSRFNGTDTRVTTFNGTSTYTPDGLFHRTELRFSGAGACLFLVDDVALHRLSGQVATPRTQTLDLPLRFEISTATGVTTMRWGMFTTTDGFFYEATYAAADLTLGVRTCTAQQMGAGLSGQPDVPVTNTITANGVSIAAPINNASTAALQITGTFVATLVFEATVDGTNFVSVSAVPVGGGAAATGATAAGAWRIQSAGYTSLRVRSTAYTSGTATVNWNITQSSGVNNTLSFNTGAPDATTQRVAAMLGVGSTAVSSTNPVPVAITGGSSAVQLVSATQRPYFQDFSSSSLTTSYTQVIASTPAAINRIFATNNSETPIFISTGAATSEVVQYILMPGENGMDIPLAIASGTRIAIRTQTGTLTSGQFSLNAF